MKTIVLGGGIVGQCYARALHAHGHQIVAFCDHAPSDALRALAAELGAPIHATPGPWLAEAGLVVSAVFGTAALDLARAACPHLQAGTLYLDMTTADPQAMRDAEGLALERGGRFVDVAITGRNTGGRDPAHQHRAQQGAAAAGHARKNPCQRRRGARWFAAGDGSPLHPRSPAPGARGARLGHAARLKYRGTY